MSGDRDFEDPARENLLAVAEAYGRATGEAQRTISRRFYGRADFLAKFRAGKQNISLRNYQDILDKFRAAWPTNADWPFTTTIILERAPRKAVKKISAKSD